MWQVYRAGTLFTGGITITKQGQVLSKLNPQAGASAEKPESQRSNIPANHQEEKGKRPGYLQPGRIEPGEKIKQKTGRKRVESVRHHVAMRGERRELPAKTLLVGCRYPGLFPFSSWRFAGPFDLWLPGFSALAQV